MRAHLALPIEIFLHLIPHSQLATIQKSMKLLLKLLTSEQPGYRKLESESGITKCGVKHGLKQKTMKMKRVKGLVTFKRR
jgi:hypothetical protein